MAIRGLKIGEFRGKHLSTGFSTIITKNFPSTLKRFSTLRKFQHTFSEQDITPINDSLPTLPNKIRILKNFAQIDQESHQKFFTSNPDQPNRVAWFNTVGTLSYIAEKNLYYDACPKEKCMKKLSPTGDGKFYCEKCGGTF